ncbi:hypothetical protein WJX72_002601 [[Myrmecia] bisecta]|uniref:Exonuclease domain-containing protein n=1 Tax=[Myrmecia] bisecta TaxID=41462 RepID=A0AAW1P2S9_9CHLO
MDRIERLKVEAAFTNKRSSQGGLGFYKLLTQHGEGCLLLRTLMLTLLPECLHKCRDKRSCRHPCCKRHLVSLPPAAAGARVTRPAPPVSAAQLINAPAATAEAGSTAAAASSGGHAFLIYDIESTGLSVKEDRILEIAFMHVASGTTFSSLVNCAPVKVNHFAYKTHGISTRIVHDPALPNFRVVGQQILDFISRHCEGHFMPVLVAHNGFRFDHSMLCHEMHRAGLALPKGAAWLDTLPLARQLLPELRRHSQAELRAHLEIEAPAVEHRALDDVLILNKVFASLAQAALADPGRADERGRLDSLMQLPGSFTGTFEALAGTLGLQELNEGTP